MYPVTSPHISQDSKRGTTTAHDQPEQRGQKERHEKEKKTYNTRDSLVVTEPTTSLALTDFSMGERTGSRVFQWVWSYVMETRKKELILFYSVSGSVPLEEILLEDNSDIVKTTTARDGTLVIYLL